MADGPTVTVPGDYLSNLEKKVRDLNSLMEVSSIISSTLDFSDLITLVMEKSKSVIQAEACSILLYNKETNKLEFAVALCEKNPDSEKLKGITLDMGQGIAGWVAEHRKPLIIEDAQNDSRFYRETDKLTGFVTRSIVSAPLVGRSGLVGVAELLNPKDKDSFDSYDAEIFQALCRQVAVAIENSLFHRAAVEQERLNRELEVAAIVQKSFLPDSPVLEKGKVRVSAISLSASQVGGDVYDFLHLGAERIGVLIGDVSGKGVSAALYMAKVVSEFRNIAHRTDAPDETLQQLHTRLSSSPRGMFLTCIYLVVDTLTGNVRLSVAGHPPLMHIHEGKVEVMTLPSGPPLGILDSEYPVESLSLSAGSKIILLTDGVFDAKNSAGKRLGFEQITDMVRDYAGEDNIIQRIEDSVDRYSQSVKQADDLTLVQIEMNKP